MVTDGVDKIYMSGPSIPVGCPPTCPAPGATNTNVTMFSASTGNVEFFDGVVYAPGTRHGIDRAVAEHFAVFLLAQRRQPLERGRE